MNKKLLLGLGVVLLIIIGYVLLTTMTAKKATENTTTTNEAAATPVAGEVFGVFTGELPCADCEGIDVVLTLNKDETYSMSNVYKGRDVAPFIEKGKWYILRGDGTNPDATVYQLVSDDSAASKQNYLLDGDQLKQLDQDMNLIEAPFNTSLTKKVM